MVSKMAKYKLSYAIMSNYQVVVEADSEDEAFEMLIREGLPTTDVDGNEVEFLSSDVFYDSIDVMEVE